MTIRALIPAIIFGLAFAPSGRSQDAEKLPAPGFHHLHLNSTNPDAAIDFYVKKFQSTSRSTWGGMPALKTGKVYVLFSKVNAPPALLPQTGCVTNTNFGRSQNGSSLRLSRRNAEQPIDESDLADNVAFGKPPAPDLFGSCASPRIPQSCSALRRWIGTTGSRRFAS
jgi:hypothetical protein